MRNVWKYLPLFCALFLVASLQGREVRRPVFTPVTVKFRLAASPRIKAGSVSSANRGSLNLVNRRWGVIEISYKPRFDYEDGKSSRNKNTAPGVWLDDVVCGVRVVVCDRQNRQNPALALFSTRVDFWTIPLDWKEHKYFVYIPPVLIERAMPSRKIDSRTVKLAGDNDFCIQVIFFHKKWGVLGEAFYGLKGRDADRDFRELTRLVPRHNVFHGSLYPRSRSPWGMNDQEQFDLEKPAFVPAPLDEAAIDKAAVDAAVEEAAFAEKRRSRSSASASGKRNRKSKR